MQKLKIPEGLNELTIKETAECYGGGIGKNIGYYIGLVKCYLSAPTPDHVQKYRESKYYMHPGKI